MNEQYTTEGQNEFSSMALHTAIAQEDLQEVKRLLEQGAEVNGSDEEGLTPLHFAVFTGNLQIIKLLLEHGADMYVKQYDGCTPVHFAALEGNKEVLKLLETYGADVNNELKKCCNDEPFIIYESALDKLEADKVGIRTDTGIHIMGGIGSKKTDIELKDFIPKQ
jgi:ankyrin repeat protein